MSPRTAAIKRSNYCAQRFQSSLRSPARTSPYGEKRRLRYHKVNGKKVQNPDGKYAASWEERYHKKRHFHHFSDDDDDAPTV